MTTTAPGIPASHWISKQDVGALNRFLHGLLYNLIIAFCDDDFMDYSLLVAHVLGLVSRTRIVKMEIIKEGGWELVSGKHLTVLISSSCVQETVLSPGNRG